MKVKQRPLIYTKSSLELTSSKAPAVNLEPVCYVCYI